MFRSGLEWGHNAARPAGIKRQTVGDSRTSHTIESFRTSTQVLPRSREKEKDPLRAAWAAKGLGRRATLLYPMYRMPPTGNTVLTASSDHLKQATYSPFDCRHSTTEQAKSST